MYNKKIPVDLNCGFRIALEVMGGKWKPYIIYELLDGPRRPSELKRALPEASERVLAQQLSELMEYGVVEKKVIDPVCKHSEYSLTGLGRTLVPIIEQMRARRTYSSNRPPDASRCGSIASWKKYMSEC